MAEAFPAMMMAGAALSAAGAIQQANAQKAASNYNATLKERDAGITAQQATQQAYQVRLASARAQGAMVADFGAAGVTSEGSPMDVLASSASQAKLDEETVLYNGKLKSMGYLSDAALLKNQGIVAGQQGQLQAASYLVGGAGQSSYAYARAGGGSRDLTPDASMPSLAGA